MQENLALFFSKPQNSLDQGVGDISSGKYPYSQKPLLENIIVASPQPAVVPNCDNNAEYLKNSEHGLFSPFGQNDNSNQDVKDFNLLKAGSSLSGNQFNAYNHKPIAYHDQPYETNVDDYAKYAEIAENYQNLENSNYKNKYKDVLQTSNYESSIYGYGGQNGYGVQNGNADFGVFQTQTGVEEFEKYAHPQANDFVTPSHADILKFSNEDAVDPQYVGKVYTNNGDVKLYSKFAYKNIKNDNPLLEAQQTDFNADTAQKLQKKRRKLRHRLNKR